ncbi:MAG: preprotein translocase subunit YajC [Actinomycetota bacterium]|jgi:preprotein translocase subunit YajC
MAPLLFPLILLGAFYFFVLRPQQRRVRAHSDLVASVAVGDEVVTAGGIVGIVTGMNDRDFDVEVAKGVVLRIVRGAIATKAPTPPEDSA